MSQSTSYLKYLKYKAKYMQLKLELEGGAPGPAMSSGDADAVIAFLTMQGDAKINDVKAGFTGKLSNKDALLSHYKAKRNTMAEPEKSRVPIPTDAQWMSYFKRIFGTLDCKDTACTSNGDFNKNFIASLKDMSIADFKKKLTTG